MTTRYPKLCGGQKKLIEKLEKALEDARAAGYALQEVLDDVERACSNATTDTNLADLSGEWTTGDDLVQTIDETEEKLEQFVEALASHDDEAEKLDPDHVWSAEEWEERAEQDAREEADDRRARGL